MGLACDHTRMVLEYASKFVSRAMHREVRCRKYVEVFGGKGLTTKLLFQNGIAAANCDVLSNKRDDFNSIKGFLWVVWLSMTIVAGGIIFS